MKMKELPEARQGLLRKFREDGYSETLINSAKWILEYFESYCKEKDLDEADIPAAIRFVEERFGFDYYNPTVSLQNSIRRPLLSLFEYSETGEYLRIHPKSIHTRIPEAFADLYFKYYDILNKQDLAKSTRVGKLWVFLSHFNYIEELGISSTLDITMKDVHSYIESQSEKYSSATMAGRKTNLRELYDWLFDNKYVSFSGNSAIPYVKHDPRDKLLSYYSKEEIDQMLSCIDNETRIGKETYAIICLLAHLGLRARDVTDLKFSNIDWNNNTIRYAQQKTGKAQCLPLVDAVKYPLIDYIKNARPDSKDPDYIFTTMSAPYTKLKSTASLHNIVTRCMRIAGIQYEGRHHGPHALRHSLASNLLHNDVPISAIAGILGHSSTMSTEAYLTIDETHIKELTLEVPNV